MLFRGTFVKFLHASPRTTVVDSHQLAFIAHDNVVLMTTIATLRNAGYDRNYPPFYV